MLPQSKNDELLQTMSAPVGREDSASFDQQQVVNSQDGDQTVNADDDLEDDTVQHEDENMDEETDELEEEDFEVDEEADETETETEDEDSETDTPKMNS